MLSALGICALLAAAPPVHLETKDLEADASPPPRQQTVAILILSGEQSGIPLSDVYGNARKVIEENTALNVAPLDVLALEERALAIRECAGKAACFASKVRANATTQVDLLLTVSLDRLDEGTLLGFRLVDVGSEEEIGAIGDEIPTGMSMLGAMEQQLADVFPKSIWGQIATLSIATEPSGAEIAIAGRSCVSPCDLRRMFPGTYDVSIRKEGYDPWTGTVSLAAKQTTQLAQTLNEPTAGLIANPFLWGGIAAVVVAGASVGAYFLFRPHDKIVTICIGKPEDCE